MEKIWLQSYAKGVPATVAYEDVTLSVAMARSAKKYAETAALYFEGTTVTFSQLEEMVNAFAGGLKAMRVDPDDKVGILLPNLVQLVVAYFGALRAGAVAVMLNPLLSDRELEYQLNDAGVRVLVSVDLLVPRMIAIRKKTKVTTIISCHIRDFLPFLKKRLFPLVKSELHRRTPREEHVEEFMHILGQNQPPGAVRKPKMDDTAVIMYTGGTTGISKGVELSQRNLSYNCQQCRAWFPGFEDGKETVVGCLPFFHSFGLTTVMNLGVMYGYGIVLIPKPEPEKILQAIHTYKATYIPAVPTMYTGMIDHHRLRDFDLKSLKACFSGAAPLPRETIRDFERLTGAQICEGYGLTETSPVTHINPFGGITKAGTVGLPLPDTEVKIVNVENYHKEITTPGERGEICVKGPQVMKGYIHRPDETEATIRDEWLFTGDIGVFDEEGYFSIVDRRKDIIVTGGMHVYPRDVDEVLYTYPKVREACVIGVPSRELGEHVKAYVALKEGKSATPEEIIEYCRRNLADYMVPFEVSFVDDLPKSPVGKILRKEVRRLHQISSGKKGRGK
ncbi:MAG: long-chain fatty acid--CoA ligase [Thermodesulfobacteriota bacterium]